MTVTISKDIRGIVSLRYLQGLPGIMKLTDIIIPSDNPTTFDEAYVATKGYTMTLKQALAGKRILESHCRLHIILCIARTLATMHHASIVHGHLTSDRIMIRGKITCDPIPTFEVVLGDFGGVVQCSTSPHTSPEVSMT
eukprot:PhF_6_TR41358/c0_g3_i7/m.62835